MQTTHQVVALQHPTHAHSQTQGHTHGQTLGHGHYYQGHCKHQRTKSEGHYLQHVAIVLYVAIEEEEINHPAYYDEQCYQETGTRYPGAQLTELLVEWGLHVAALLTASYAPTLLGVHTHMCHAVHSHSVYHGRTAPQLVYRVCRLLILSVHGLRGNRLAGEHRFVYRQMLGSEQESVGWHLIATLQTNYVAHTHILLLYLLQPD